MYVLICGSRGFKDYKLLSSMVSNILKDEGNVTVVSGTAAGADRLGERFARDNKFAVKRVPADWNRYGKRAGFIRNKEMVDIADLVIAFDLGTAGTAHTVKTAMMKNIKCYHIDCS